MQSGMIKGLGSHLQQAQQVVTDSDDRETFDCSLDLQLDRGPVRHRTYLHSVLILDLDLNPRL